MTTEQDKENMRLALRVMYGVEIVGDVDVKWWPHVPEAITNARLSQSLCASCKARRFLCATTILEDPKDPTVGRYFHFCETCKDHPEAIEDARKYVQEMLDKGTVK